MSNDENLQRPTIAAVKAAEQIADDFIAETYLRADRVERWARLIDAAFAGATPPAVRIDSNLGKQWADVKAEEVKE